MKKFTHIIFLILLALGTFSPAASSFAAEGDTLYKVTISEQEKEALLTNTSCLHCDMVQFMYVIGSRLSYIMYKLIGNSLDLLVVVGFAFWLLWHVYSALTSGKDDATEMVVEIFKKMAWVSFAYYLLSLNPVSFYRNTMSIILDAGIDYSYVTLSQVKALEGAEDKSINTAQLTPFQKHCATKIDKADDYVEGYAFPLSTKRDLICLVERIAGAYNDNIKFGWLLVRYSVSPPSGVLPIPNVNFFMIIAGLLICGIYFMASIYFIFYFVDAVFKLALAGIFAPIAIAGYAFGVTEKLLDKVINYFKNSAFLIVFLCIILGLTNQMLLKVATGEFTINLSDGNVWELTIKDMIDEGNSDYYDEAGKLKNVGVEVLERYSEGKFSWLLLVLAGAICLAMTGKVNNLVEDWAGSDLIAGNLRQAFDGTLNKIKSISISVGKDIKDIKDSTREKGGERILENSIARDQADEAARRGGAGPGSRRRGGSPRGGAPGSAAPGAGSSGGPSGGPRGGAGGPDTYRPEYGDPAVTAVSIPSVKETLDKFENETANRVSRYIDRYPEATTFNEIVDKMWNDYLAFHKMEVANSKLAWEQTKEKSGVLPEVPTETQETVEFKNLKKERQVAMDDYLSRNGNIIQESDPEFKRFSVAEQELIKKIAPEKLSAAQMKRRKEKAAAVQEQLQKEIREAERRAKNKVGLKDMLLAEWEMQLEEARKKNMTRTIKNLQEKIASIEEMEDYEAGEYLKAMAKSKGIRHPAYEFGNEEEF